MRQKFPALALLAHFPLCFSCANLNYSATGLAYYRHMTDCFKISRSNVFLSR